MNSHTYNSIAVTIGMLGVFGATYFTGNANCLWALILVGFFIKS